MDQRKTQIRILIRALLVMVVLVGVPFSRAQDGHNPNKRKLLEPFQMREDFQGDSLGQWASYPPAQDVGYEPSLSPTSDYDAPGHRALMRVVKPNRAGMQRFGFIKKVRMTVAPDSRLRFSYRVNSPSPAMIEIGLAGVDGRRYTTKLAAKTNQWSIANLSFAELRAPIGVGVEAIYIVANIQNVDPNFSYNFIIDDVAVSALREARFDLRIPRGEMIDPWPSLISARSYSTGDMLLIEARAPAALAKAECSLETNTGRRIATERLFDDGSHGDKISADGIWTNNQLYKLGVSDPAGVWMAKLGGTTTDGQSIETPVRIIIRPEKRANHPRLFFDSTDREKLIADRKSVV